MMFTRATRYEQQMGWITLRLHSGKELESSQACRPRVDSWNSGETDGFPSFGVHSSWWVKGSCAYMACTASFHGPNCSFLNTYLVLRMCLYMLEETLIM